MVAAALDGGGARPTRLPGLFAAALEGGAPLGPAAFDFTRFPLAALAAAGGVTAAAGVAARFLFWGMVAEIMADTSPMSPTGTSTTVDGGETCGAAARPAAVVEACGRSMPA